MDIIEYVLGDDDHLWSSVILIVVTGYAISLIVGAFKGE